MRKKKHWHQGPPWWHQKEGEWAEDAPEPPWMKGHTGEEWKHARWRPRHMGHQHWDPGARRHGGGELFFRFAAVFGLFVLLSCGILALLGAATFFLLPHRLPPDFHPGRFVLALAGILALLALALRGVARFASRRFTTPLSETMNAADSLAAGDLSARVPVRGDGEFRHFAESFNHMADALETADRHRRELLADVAHELRTPLTVVQGNLEGLRDGVYDATPEHLELVLDETRKLSRLVDDLRLLTLAEAGQLPLDPQMLDVSQLLADVRDAFAHQASEEGLLLEVAPPETDLALYADPQRVGQILGNLVANALRHTPAGGQVTLGASAPDGGEGAGWLKLWVSDTGEGIPPEDLPRIFDRFWRGDPARTHEAGAGSGLGLAIARSLVETHGGHIQAESRLGEGTTVSCWLPEPAPLQDH